LLWNPVRQMPYLSAEDMIEFWWTTRASDTIICTDSSQHNFAHCYVILDEMNEQIACWLLIPQWSAYFSIVETEKHSTLIWTCSGEYDWNKMKNFERNFYYKICFKQFCGNTFKLPQMFKLEEFLKLDKISHYFMNKRYYIE
jgi:hypothetical protein